MVKNKCIAVFLMIFVTAGLLSAKNPPQQTAPDGAPKAKAATWVTSYRAAMKTAQSEKRPVLIKFHAAWCGWCKKMDRDVFSQPKIAEELEEFVCVSVDTDRHRDIGNAFKINALPRVIVVNTHNEIVGDWIGYRDAEAFSKLLKDVAEYTHIKTGLTPLPVIVEEVLKSTEQADAVKIDPNDPNGIIDLLGHKSPDVRSKAIEILVKGGPKTLPTVLLALQSKYLGTRIAAWKVLRKSKPRQYKFDPWAPGPKRAKALNILQKQIPLPPPKAARVSQRR